jgi:hypothetical protein
MKASLKCNWQQVDLLGDKLYIPFPGRAGLRGGGEDVLAAVGAEALIELMGILLGVVVIRNLESIC